MATSGGDFYFTLFCFLVFSKFYTSYFCKDKPQNMFKVRLKTK